MSFQDKSVHCSDCKTPFSFSAEEQEVLQSTMHTKAQTLSPVPRARKTERYGDGDYSYRSRTWR